MDRLTHPETQAEAGRIRERELRERAERERLARDSSPRGRLRLRPAAWAAALLRGIATWSQPPAPCPPELERQRAG